MRDLRTALALARQEAVKTTGYTGYTGYSVSKVSQNSDLREHEPVTSPADQVVTLVTGNDLVTSVTSGSEPLVTLPDAQKSESKQQLTPSVTSVTTVTSEKEQLREISQNGAEAGAVRRWRAGMASFAGSFPPCPGFSPDKWLRVRQAAARFLDEFGEKAAAFGWGDLDLFGVHPEVGIVRGDSSGALMLSNGRRIVAVSEHTIAYEDKLTFYRKPARERGPSVVIWEFKGGPHG